MRHGVRRDSTPYVLMPSHAFNVVTDEELTALYAFLRTIPPREYGNR